MTDPQEVREHIANLIRSRRLALRLDQSVLAERSGISQAALSRYEAAAASVRAEDVPRLAKALVVSPDAFYLETMAGLKPLGPEWSEAEARLVANFRRLPPEERLKAFRSVQRQVEEFDTTFMEHLEAISIGGTRHEDSGVVSKIMGDEEGETLENVL